MTAKTPEQETAYAAGRQDAQVLCNLFFAGRGIRPPDLCSGDIETVAVPKASLLAVVRKLDFGAALTTDEFACALDDLRAAFTPDEIATGNLS
ncbi:hypothetical protein [Phaeobacter inhibens]|uniref:hypothetical protein n=1 Tax=Phaeobacter inhibens TaxID=221822 RepID=UPI000C9D0391|nr:hypothetical protein [Phaeobacter inhibens]AUQ62147.1 hypothetical protein PhaeoP51_01149 [Phaeobacter inhibens]AUQ89858.1 hypothetical protein PhaeoP24_01230 [Phaeobacter inhibens]